MFNVKVFHRGAYLKEKGIVRGVTQICLRSGSSKPFDQRLL